MKTVEFYPKFVSETRTLRVDFSDDLPVGASITSRNVSAALYSGTDATPSNLLSGSASVSGTEVTQNVIAGVAGAIYALTFSATFSTGQTVIKVGLLAVLPTSAL